MRYWLFGGLLAACLVLLGLGALLLLRFNARGEGSAFQRVAKNSLFPTVTSLLNKLMDLAFAMYMLRVLQSDGVGKYTFAVVVIGYLDILANFGLGTLLTREVAKDRTAGGVYLGNTLAARVGLWVVSLAAVGLLLGPGAGPMGITADVATAILLLTLGLLPSLVASTLSALFMAHERFEHPAAVTVLTNVLKIALGVAALASGWGIVGLAGVSVVANLATVAMLLVLVRGLGVGGPGGGGRGDGETGRGGEGESEGPGGGRPHGGVWGVPNSSISPRPSLGIEVQTGSIFGMLRTSYPLMLNNLLNSVFFRVDSLMLKPMAGDAALGYYGTAYKFIDGLGIISSSFTLALFPLLSQYAHSARDSLARAFGLSIKLLLVVSLPIAVGTTLIAPEIILLFAGPDYLPHSALALQILIWFLPFSFVNGVTQYLLIAIDQQRFITLSFLVATAFNLVANLLLIPWLGYRGAALTTVASEWVLMIPFWYCVRKHLPPVPLAGIVWRPALASAMMGLEVWALRDWNLPLAIALAPPLYGAALLALRTFDQDELAMVRRMLPGRK